MNKEPYYEKGKMTGKEYNLWDVIRILNPKHYLITDFGIENLNVSYVKYANGGYVKCGIEDAIDYTGDVTMVLLQYNTEQEHYQDSYVLNKKVKRLALKSAFSSKFLGNNIIVLDNIKLEEYKTKTMIKILQNIKAEG